jgi:ribosomal protein S27E
MTEEGYKGFLLIRCASCGHERAFYSRFAISWYKCSQCGEKTILGHLRELWTHCECGKRSYYLTNIEDDTAEVNCIDCGAPVACEWNEKKKCYQTIKV